MNSELLKEIISDNIAATVATIGLVIYFLCTAVVFLAKPENSADSIRCNPWTTRARRR